MKLGTKTKTAAATFGAAMASIYVAPELYADKVPVGLIPGSVPYQGTGSQPAVPVTVFTAGPLGGFSQWNDGISSAMFAPGAGITSWAAVSFSQTFTPGNFIGGSGALFGATAGTFLVGFRAGGNVGWFGVSFFGPGAGPVIYLPGQYGNQGERVHAGQFLNVPEPSTAAGLGLGMLALGAVGLRRKRKNKQA